MKTTSMILIALGGMVAMPAQAQTAGAFMTNPAFQGPRPLRCTSTVDMQRCAAADLRAADAKMSRRYDMLRARLGPSARQSLLVEQRNWLRARDRDCLATYDRGGGSMASLGVARCWVSKTQARSQELGRRLAQEPVTGEKPAANAFVGRWRGGEGT